MSDDDRIACRTPSVGKGGVTRIPRWKYDLLRGHILHLVGAAGAGGFEFSELADAIAGRLADDERRRLGSVGWHSTTVKLEMEVAGDISRLPGSGHQRLVLGAT